MCAHRWTNRRLQLTERGVRGWTNRRLQLTERGVRGWTNRRLQLTERGVRGWTNRRLQLTERGGERCSGCHLGGEQAEHIVSGGGQEVVHLSCVNTAV